MSEKVRKIWYHYVDANHVRPTDEVLLVNKWCFVGNQKAINVTDMLRRVLFIEILNGEEVPHDAPWLECRYRNGGGWTKSIHDNVANSEFEYRVPTPNPPEDLAGATLVQAGTRYEPYRYFSNIFLDEEFSAELTAPDLLAAVDEKLNNEAYIDSKHLWEGDAKPYGPALKAVDGRGTEALRTMFPDATADELNFVLFSTGGVHGFERTLEDISTTDTETVTFLLVQPRIALLRYGVADPQDAEDFLFLRKLRKSSHDVVARIGMPEYKSTDMPGFPSQILGHEVAAGATVTFDEATTDPDDRVELSRDWYTQFVKELFGEMSELIEKKNADYTGGSDDPFANFKQSTRIGVPPLSGIYMRMQDKCQRVEAWLNKGSLKVEGEGLEDAFRDLIGYSCLALGMLQEEKRS